MSEQDEVQSALRAVVDNYGTQALSSETVLGNLLSDLLPDNQREASLLVLAARSDVPGNVVQRIREGMDPDTAVRLTASSMTESSPAAPEACLWVTNEIARALGHQVSVAGSVAPTSQPTVQAGAPAGPSGFTSAPTAVAPHVQPSAPPPGAPTQQQGWPPQPTSSPGPAGPGTGGWPPPGPAPQGPPPVPGQWPQGPIGSTPPKKKRTGLVVGAGIGGLVLVVIVFLIVAAAAKIAPFSSSSPHVTTPRQPTPSGSTPSNPGAAQLSLAQLMPFSNLQDPTGYDESTCNNSIPFSGMVLKGLQENLSCGSLPNFSGWVLYGYKFDNAADYQAGLNLYNSPPYIAFDPTTADQGCPPSSDTSKGIQGWHSGAYPEQPQGQQVIECLQTLNGQNQQLSTYIWTLPTQHAFFEIDAPPSVPFSTVDQWWLAHGTPGSGSS